MISKNRTRNNQRSNSLNPNNRGGGDARNQRSNSLNPNNRGGGDARNQRSNSNNTNIGKK